MAYEVGGVSFDLDVNLKSFEKQLDKAFSIAKKKGAGLVWDTSSFVAGIKMTKKEFKAFSNEVDKARDKYEELLDLQKGLQSSDLWGQLGDQAKSAVEDAVSMAKAEADLYKRTKRFMGLGRGIKTVFGGLGKVFGGVFSIFRRNTAKAGAEFGGFLKRLIGIAGVAALLRKAFSFAREGMENLVKADATTANSVNTLRGALTALKNALASAFAPILNTIAPILAKFIGMLTAAANAVASFLSALTGRKFAVVANNVSGGFDGIGSSASGANDSAKELQRTLMGFDKINKLDSDSGGGGGGGTGGGGAGGGGGFDLVPVGDEANAWADKFRESWEKADFYWLGELLANKLNDALEKIPWDTIQEGARKLAKSLATFLNGFIENADWNLVGETLANGLNTAVYFAQTFVHTFNWGALGDAIANTINGFFKKTDWSAIGDTIGTAIYGLLTTINNFLKKTDWSAIGSAVVEMITSIKWGDLLRGAVELIENIANGIFDMVKGAVETAWTKLKTWISTKWEELFTGGSGKVELTASLTSWTKGSGFSNTIGGMIAEFASKTIKSGVELASKVTGWVAEFSSKTIKAGVSLAQTVSGWVAEFSSKIIQGGVSFAETVSGWVAKFTKKDDKGIQGGSVDLIAKFTGKPQVKLKKKDKVISGFTAKVTKVTGLDTVKAKGTGVKLVKEKGGLYKNGKWSPIQRYAEGGLPSGSQLFWAREKGPELVGTLGGHTAVMNNDQIVASVSAGVARAIAGIKFKMTAPPLAITEKSPVTSSVPDNGIDNRQMVDLLSQILEAIVAQDTNVYLDGEKIKNNVVRRINNHTRATGQLELII